MELNKILQEILTHLDSDNITNINTDITSIASGDNTLGIN
nr:MAG TPA: hypothetical protein [Caudoviricetes sp.]